jgi:hypothetical protein
VISSSRKKKAKDPDNARGVEEKDPRSIIDRENERKKNIMKNPTTNTQKRFASFVSGDALSVFAAPPSRQPSFLRRFCTDD